MFRACSPPGRIPGWTAAADPKRAYGSALRSDSGSVKWVQAAYRPRGVSRTIHALSGEITARRLMTPVRIVCLCLSRQTRGRFVSYRVMKLTCRAAASRNLFVE